MDDVQLSIRFFFDVPTMMRRSSISQSKTDVFEEKMEKVNPDEEPHGVRISKPNLWNKD